MTNPAMRYIGLIILAAVLAVWAFSVDKPRSSVPHVSYLPQSR